MPPIADTKCHDSDSKSESKTTPKTTKIDTIVLKERFDQHALATILANFDVFKKQLMKKRNILFKDPDYDPFKLGQKYLDSSHEGVVHVKYLKCAKASKNKGRFFAIGQPSLQGMCRELRHTISHKYYNDLDVVNCHAVIFQHMCKTNGFDCPKLTEFINDRENILKKIPLKRDKAKNIFLSCINGGRSDYNKLSVPPKFLREFMEEVTGLHAKFIQKESKEFKAFCDYRELYLGKDFNHKGSFMNVKFCIMENDILMSLWRFFKQPKDCVLCFDGIMLRKYVDIDIAGAEKHIRDEVGIDIKLKIKPMDDRLDLNVVEPVEYTTEDFMDYAISKAKTIRTGHELDKLKNDVVEYINKDHALVKANGSFYIYEHTDVASGNVKLVCKSKKDMELDFADCVLKYKLDTAKKPASINAFRLWNESRARRKYTEVAFDPALYYKLKDNKIRSKKIPYNYFTGYDHEREDLVDIEPLKESAPFFRHIKKRWCNYDKELYEYILNWFAHVIQKPHQKTGVAIILMSEERAGKGIIVQLIAKIIGKKYFFQPSSTNSVTGNFNSGLQGKILTFLDEMTWGGDVEKAGILKKLVTEPKVTINAKNRSIIEIDNRNNLISAGNGNGDSYWLVPSGMTSTRWLCVELNNELSYMTDLKMKKKIIDGILNTDVRRLAKFFYERDISKFVPREIVMTEALRKQKIESLSKLGKWWLDILNSGYIALGADAEEIRVGKPMDKKEVYESYKAYSHDRYSTVSDFWKKMKKYDDFKLSRKVSKSGGRKQRREVVFSDLEVLRYRWRKITTDEGWKFPDEESDIESEDSDDE